MSDSERLIAFVLSLTPEQADKIMNCPLEVVKRLAAEIMEKEEKAAS